jgi:hypothetical protein
MKAFVSIMALAVALAWPAAGEAQSGKSTARAKATTQQKVKRPAKAVARQSTSRTPCAGYAWWGCTGWDPDPNVRSMLARDFNDDND